jgi:hypothetical protein
VVCLWAVASDGRWTFTPSDQVKLYVDQLKGIGVYGKKRGDVVNHLLGEAIMVLLKDKTLARLSPEQEREFAAQIKEEDDLPKG